MRGLRGGVLVVGAAVLLGAGAADGRRASGTGTESRSGYIVVFAEGVDVDAKTAALARSLRIAPTHVYRHAIEGFAAPLTPAQADALSSDSGVKFLSPDGVVRIAGTEPIEPGEEVPPGIRRVGSVIGNEIQRKGKNVAVIDTGIALGHPDLNPKHGRDCVNAPPAEDDNGHGTHIAGTIGARNTGSGIVGASPGALVYAVKVISANGSGTFAHVICGIDWVTAKARRLKIKVVNLSIGAQGSDDGNCGNSNADALHQAICRSAARGVTYVVPAGSSASGFHNTIPAAYDEVLTVTAMADSDGEPGGNGGDICGQSDDARAVFSSFATLPADEAHTIAAPGVCIKSTWLGGGYNIVSGTSFATAHVTGIVSTCYGHPGAPGPCAGKSPAQVIQKIRGDAAAHATPENGFFGDPNDPIPGRYYGYLAWAGEY